MLLSISGFLWDDEQLVAKIQTSQNSDVSVYLVVPFLKDSLHIKAVQKLLFGSDVLYLQGYLAGHPKFLLAGKILHRAG